MKDNNPEKQRQMNKHVYDFYDDITERKLTNNTFVNTEFEMWQNLAPSRVIPLRDQRRPLEHYVPTEFKESMNAQSLKAKNELNPYATTQIFYGNFYESWNEYYTPEGIKYWHNPDLNVSTWDDPNFILNVLISNHIENSIDMIPLHWDPIDNTPFLELTMRNGLKLYIHKGFKRVFKDNPMVSQEKVSHIQTKINKENNVMERIKNSRMKRRQIKESVILGEDDDNEEQEVRLETSDQEEEKRISPLGLKIPVIHRPGEKSQQQLSETPSNELELPSVKPLLQENEQIQNANK